MHAQLASGARIVLICVLISDQGTDQNYSIHTLCMRAQVRLWRDSSEPARLCDTKIS